MNRSKAREQLMQLVFQMEIQDNYSKEAADVFIDEYLEDRSQIEYINETINAVRINKDTIDAKIEASSNNWKLGRISKVDLSILRLAIAEILFIDSIPDSVSADEAVELAKRFGGKDSSKFINGVIGRVIRSKDGE